MPEPAGFYSPFDGDGRTKVTPTTDIRRLRPEATPVSLTRSAARFLIDDFIKHGQCKLSAAGATVWVIETWAHFQGVEIKVIKHPFGGYWIKLIEEVDEAPIPTGQAEIADYGY